MPNITEYTAPIDQVRPSDAAADTAREAGAVENRFAMEAGETLGSAISRVGNQLGQVVDNHVASTMISHGAATYASLFADLTKQWNETAAKADPNDSSIMAGFTEKVLTPSLDKFMEAFNGAPEKAKSWAQDQVDLLLHHFSSKMAADSSTRAGIAVQKNIDDMTRGFANAAASDPTSLGHIVDTINSTVDAQVGSNPFLTPDQQATVRDELIPKMTREVGHAAYYGMATQNPDAAKAALAKGDFDTYMTPEERIRADKFADGIKHVQVNDAIRQHELDKIQQRDASEKAEDEYIKSILRGGRPSGGSVAADLNLTPEARMRINNFQFEHTRQLKEQAETTPHPETVRNILNDLFQKAQNDPNNLSVTPIRQAFSDGNLNPHEEQWLEDRFNSLDKPMERNYQGQLNRVERFLTQSITLRAMSAADPTVMPTVLNEIDRDAHAKLDQVRNSGGDVNALLDPKSQNYLFSPATINGYIHAAGVGKNLPTPSQDTPSTNEKGWILKVDKNGNQAYVSPDGKQFEEVKSGHQGRGNAATQATGEKPQ